MIIAVVRFPLPPGTSRADAKAAFEASVPQFAGAPGLMRKHYLFAEREGGGAEGGGVYLWENREAADRVYTDAFRHGLAERFGEEPRIEFYDSPVTIDNIRA